MRGGTPADRPRSEHTRSRLGSSGGIARAHDRNALIVVARRDVQRTLSQRAISSTPTWRLRPASGAGNSSSARLSRERTVLRWVYRERAARALLQSSRRYARSVSQSSAYERASGPSVRSTNSPRAVLVLRRERHDLHVVVGRDACVQRRAVEQPLCGGGVEVATAEAVDPWQRRSDGASHTRDGLERLLEHCDVRSLVPGHPHPVRGSARHHLGCQRPATPVLD